MIYLIFYPVFQCFGLLALLGLLAYLPQFVERELEEKIYKGRLKTEFANSTAIKEKKIQGFVVLSRDHHDVGGTDSPYRETSAIDDGSKFTADMAI